MVGVIMNLLARVASSISACLMLCMLISCQKDLVYSGKPAKSRRLTVAFDWTKASEAAPRTMRVSLYPSSATHPLDYELVNTNADTISLSPDTYQLLCYNGDTERVLSRGDSFDTFELYTRTTEMARAADMFSEARDVPRAGGTEELELVLEPDPLWTGSASEVVVTPEDDAEATIAMRRATECYTFVISNVSNLQYVSDVAATLSGVSGSTYPSTGHCSDTRCIIPFAMNTIGETTLKGTVRCMGHCPQAKTAHMLVVYAMLRDGSKYYYTFDVTEVMHSQSASDAEVYIIELADIPFPKPITNGSGLHPSVDTWQSVQIEVKM